MTIVDKSMEQLADKIVAERDELILSVLPAEDQEEIRAAIALGQIGAIHKKGMIITAPNNDVETFVWDGKPLLRFYPMNFTVIDNKFIAKQRVERL